MGGYALAAITRGLVTGVLPDDIFGAFIGSLTIGIEAGARIGIAPTLVIGWPLHLILLRTGFIHLYDLYHVRCGPLGRRHSDHAAVRVPRWPLCFRSRSNDALLAAGAGGIGAFLLADTSPGSGRAQPSAS